MRSSLGIVSKGKIQAIRELDKEEYAAYKSASKYLMDFSSGRQLFRYVQWNYENYLNMLKSHFEEYVRNPSLNWHRIEAISLSTGMGILNYLLAIRIFLEHTEISLKKRYGAGSQRVTRFKAACSNEYDRHFSYRFFYKLRNYVQHCGMPPIEFSLQSKEVDPNTKQVSHSLEVRLNRDELLSFDGWGSQVKGEIQGLPSKFEISEYVSEMMKCLERIDRVLVEDDIPELMKSTEYIRQMIAPTKNIGGTPCILKVTDTSGNRKELKVEIEWIPLHLVEAVEKLF